MLNNKMIQGKMKDILWGNYIEMNRELIEKLGKKLDARLIKTMQDLSKAILAHRNRGQGMILSELGGWIAGADKAPAGVKRITRLLESQNWDEKDIEEHLWQQATEKVMELQQPQEAVYVIWDESVIEKPESLQSERLCPVRSSKAVRLKRIKPGYFNPPGGRPVFVPGFNWLQILVLGMKSTPQLAHLRWWTTRGPEARKKREEEAIVLKKLDQMWGKMVVHIWDRGFASHSWINLALEHDLRFIVRWRKDYKLVDSSGEAKKAWIITRGKRSLDFREIYDAKHRNFRRTGLYYTKVFLKDSSIPLWLVVSRPGKGKIPWYLLTNEFIDSVEDAWQVIFAYSRRWQIEMSIRFLKSELAFESPRLRKWRSRYRLMMIAALVYNFLLSLLSPAWSLIRSWLLDSFCHRTGSWTKATKFPLYRLRLAFSNLLIPYFKHFTPDLLNPG